ncbi:cysteine--tRNA ligase [archaeon BMS3Abin16]|nr:cysteine--tRNA ligase [archaeon BMS3Abin16]
MVLKIYNTQARRKEVFIPLEKGKVKIYVCGVTPYDLSHVGHARSYVAFDVIRRVFEYLGYKVTYVQNFTDVDDKIIARAKKEGIDPLALSQRYIGEYFKDMDALGVKRADSYPCVSEKIPEIIHMVAALIEKGVAYEVDGDVYLDVSKKKDYGKLSAQPIEELKAGARIRLDEKKRSPLDFALWKKAKPDEISWPSPWGEGRPGWHIECSVMSMELLGSTLDIHGGGQDLIFPHHENEIAQSESYSGRPFVRYWLHNGLVTVEGQKMSKSLGNFITIRELLTRHDPHALRFFLLSAHYRHPLDFSERALEDANKGLKRIQTTIFNIKNAMTYASNKGDDSFRGKINSAKKDFLQALCDDFNIPGAIATLFTFTREINAYVAENPGKADLEDALEILRELTGVLGLSFKEEAPELVKGLIEEIIQIRVGFREKKDYEASDNIRERLLSLGISIEDRRQGTVWRFIVSSESQL